MTYPLEPFPEDKAAKVLEYARKLGQEAVVKIIDTIRDVFGHPEKVVPMADSWGLDAKVAVLNATDSITTARANLAAYWEGSAYDSFTIYVDHLEKVFEKATEVFAGEADLLQEVATTMTDIYTAGVGFIYECAAVIVEATGGIIAGAKEWLFGIAEAVCNAISDFIRAGSELLQKVMIAVNDYRKDGQDLRQQAAELKVPESIPSSSVDVDGWDVRKREKD